MILLLLGWDETESFVTAAANGPIVQSPDNRRENGAIVEW
jgi:hypothetical protein